MRRSIDELRTFYGEPTGALKEAAGSLVEDLIPEPSAALLGGLGLLALLRRRRSC